MQASGTPKQLESSNPFSCSLLPPFDQYSTHTPHLSPLNDCSSEILQRGSTSGPRLKKLPLAPPGTSALPSKMLLGLQPIRTAPARAKFTPTSECISPFAELLRAAGNIETAVMPVWGALDNFDFLSRNVDSGIMAEEQAAATTSCNSDQHSLQSRDNTAVAVPPGMAAADSTVSSRRTDFYQSSNARDLTLKFAARQWPCSGSGIDEREVPVTRKRGAAISEVEHRSSSDGRADESFKPVEVDSSKPSAKKQGKGWVGFAWLR